jgi:proteasome lid subunit RPN8/RPN11
MFGAEVDAAAKAHAIAQYPKESCGVVSAAAYVPLENQAEHPEDFFQLPETALVDHAPVAAVIHSHCFPRHGPEPSALDMRSQIEAALPFAIVHTDGKVAGEPIWFGDVLLDQPLFDAQDNHIGRQFLHGVNDCYSLIRTWYWQARKIKLPEFPRDNDWWKHGGDLYREGFAKAGFALIQPGSAAPADVQPGDVVLMRWGQWQAPYHAGIVLEHGLVLHHLNGRLSRREPLARWTRQITHWLRYSGEA